MEIRQGTIL